MKAISVRQPHASLICPGPDRDPVKSIETRSWSTKYRGQVLICASARRPVISSLVPWYEAGQHCNADMGSGPWDHGLGPVWWHWGIFPLGVALGVATIVDCLPVVDWCRDREAHICRSGSDLLAHSPLTEPWPDGETEHIVTAQLPYGDFTPGRFGSLLDNIISFAEPIPIKGRLGLFDPPADVQAQVREQLG